MNIFFQWSYGNDILNANRMVFENPAAKQNTNMFAAYTNRWTPENPNATYPRLSMSDSKNRVTSSFWMQDASYAKLRNLQVGYSLPKQLISKYGISRLRVYCSIDNLFMISGFDGVDPEAISGNYYPLTRNYSFGLNVTF